MVPPGFEAVSQERKSAQAAEGQGVSCPGVVCSLRRVARSVPFACCLYYIRVGPSLRAVSTVIALLLCKCMTQPSKDAARLGEPSYVWRAGQNRRLEMIRQWGHLDEARRVLDVGTGMGLYLEQMRAAGPNVELAAGTEYEFARARQAAARNHAVVAAEPLPFPDNIFDLDL